MANGLIRAPNLSNITQAFSLLGQSNRQKALAELKEKQDRRNDKSNSFRTIGTIAGAVIGGAYSGGTGTAAGAAIGSQIGNAAGGLFASTQGGNQVSSGEIVQTGASALSIQQQQGQKERDDLLFEQKQEDRTTAIGQGEDIQTSRRQVLTTDFGVAQESLNAQKQPIEGLEGAELQSAQVNNQEIDQRINRLQQQADRGVVPQAQFRNQIRTEIGESDTQVRLLEDGSIVAERTDLFTKDVDQKVLRNPTKKGKTEIFNTAYLGKNDEVMVKSHTSAEAAQKFAEKNNGEVFKPGGQPVLVRDLLARRAAAARVRAARVKATKEKGPKTVRVDITTKIGNEADKQLRKEREEDIDADPSAPLSEEEKVQRRMDIIDEKIASGNVSNQKELEAWKSKISTELTDENTKAALAAISNPTDPVIANNPHARLQLVGQFRNDLASMKFIDKEAIEAELAKTEAIAQAEIKKQEAADALQGRGTGTFGAPALSNIFQNLFG